MAIPKKSLKKTMAAKKDVSTEGRVEQKATAVRGAKKTNLKTAAVLCTGEHF